MSSPRKSSPSSIKPDKIELPKPVDPTKLPRGAKVSPLSPFFTDRAAQCLLAEGTGTPDYLRHAPNNIIEREMRAMAPPPAPQVPEKVARPGPLMPLSEAVFPPGMPMIPHSEWSKFGIQLFKPNPALSHVPMTVNSSNSSSGSNAPSRNPGPSRAPAPHSHHLENSYTYSSSDSSSSQSSSRGNNRHDRR